MLNDGGLRDDSGALSVNRTLCQRLFLFDLLSSGISLSTLSGVQFRDSKVSMAIHQVCESLNTFLYRFSPLYLSPGLTGSPSNYLLLRSLQPQSPRARL